MAGGCRVKRAMAAADEGDVDVAELLSKTDKIKVLMRRDPRFIGRLITVRPQQIMGACACVCAQLAVQ